NDNDYHHSYLRIISFNNSDFYQYMNNFTHITHLIKINMLKKLELFVLAFMFYSSSKNPFPSTSLTSWTTTNAFSSNFLIIRFVLVNCVLAMTTYNTSVSFLE